VRARMPAPAPATPVLPSPVLRTGHLLADVPTASGAYARVPGKPAPSWHPIRRPVGPWVAWDAGMCAVCCVCCARCVLCAACCTFAVYMCAACVFPVGLQVARGCAPAEAAADIPSWCSHLLGNERLSAGHKVPHREVPHWEVPQLLRAALGQALAEGGTQAGRAGHAAEGHDAGRALQAVRDKRRHIGGAQRVDLRQGGGVRWGVGFAAEGMSRRENLMQYQSLILHTFLSGTIFTG